MSILCKYCGNPIVFDDNRLSKNGKLIPLQEWNLQPHNCKFSPYNRSKIAATSEGRIAADKEGECQLIENLREKVAATNNRLEYYEVELIMTRKE